jgi:hypothetical protein
VYAAGCCQSLGVEARGYLNKHHELARIALTGRATIGMRGLSMQQAPSGRVTPADQKAGAGVMAQVGVDVHELPKPRSTLQAGCAGMHA